MAELTRQDQAVLADRFIDVPWCVYVQGLDEVFCCETGDGDHPVEGCARPFDRERATVFAGNVRKSSDALAAMPGVQAPEITAFVLWHGIVWVVR